LGTVLRAGGSRGAEAPLGARRLCPAERSPSLRCPFQPVSPEPAVPWLLRAGGSAPPVHARTLRGLKGRRALGTVRPV
jgi:hypothetical protein